VLCAPSLIGTSCGCVHDLLLRAIFKGKMTMESRTIERADLESKLGVTPEQFTEMFLKNNYLDFPPPLDSEAKRWPVGDMLDWVVRSQSKLLDLVQHISVVLDKKP
jgi:hypothetical protein